MRTYFHHQVVDVSSLARFCVDAGVIPDTACSGSGLLKYLKLGDVAHTALEDAVVTAKAYFGLMQAIKNKSIKN
jgi:DNA polymerase-3 subunit epsilon